MPKAMTQIGKEHVEIPGVNEKRSEFPGVLMKKSCEFPWPWVLVFDLENSKGCQIILQNFQR